MRRIRVIALCAAMLGGAACRADAAPENVPAKKPGAAANAGSPSGRNAMWKLSEEELRARKAKLSADSFRVTQKEGTEPPFRNAYWDNHSPGIYVDVVSGEPLFASTEKFDSGTGWPSFWAPLEKELVVEKTDGSLLMARTEVRSRIGESHLGHVFNDGPRPTGLRYCINSAALRFIPAERLVAEGYGDYAKKFPNVKQVGEAPPKK